MLHIFLSFVFFNIIVFNLYGHYKKGDYYVKKSDLLIYIALFILFGTYGGGEGDFFHYKDIIEEHHSLSDVLFYSGMEPQYVYLSYFVGGNYYLWRFVLFSIEFLGFGYFLYKAKLNTYAVLLSFTTLCLVSSVYGRAYWGGIYFFFGVYLLIEKKNPLYIIAILLSYVSHTSGLIRIALLPLAFINIKKWHLIALMFSFGLIVAIFKDALIDLLNSGGFDADGASYINSRLETYANEESKAYFGKSLGTTISIVLKDLFVVSVIYTVVALIFKNNNGYSAIYKPLRGVINICLGVFILSAIILAASVGSGPLFYRVFDMTVFMVAIIIPCLKDVGVITKKRFIIYIYWFIFYSEYRYIIDLYYAYVEGI